jgi:hypothetical protein
MSIFATKLGMALYAEHIEEVLPVEGGVYSFWMLNGGINNNIIDALLNFMPNYGAIAGGRNVIKSQFEYRYNTDNKSVVAALSKFHSNLYIFPVASGNREFLDDKKFPETGAIINTGELLKDIA